MLNVSLPMPVALMIALVALSAPAAAQDFAPHRAVYEVSAIERGKPTAGASGTYAYELRQTCDGYIVNQRLRLETPAARGASATEQQSQMTESRDGKKLRFEHRTTVGGKQVSLIKGEGSLGDGGSGEARFTDPEGQTVALPTGTFFPVALARQTVRLAKAGENGFDAQFFFGEKVKPPQSVNVLIGKVPKRPGRPQDSRRFRSAGRRPRSDILPRWFFRCRSQGPGRASLRDEQHNSRQWHRALRYP